MKVVNLCKNEFRKRLKLVSNCRVPTGTGNPGKPGKMRQLFPVREKSGNFEKILKSQGILNESGKSQGKL